MFRLSAWQWQRYLWKVALVESYGAIPDAKPIPFTPEGDHSSLVDQRVILNGHFDYSKQLIVTNKKSGEDSFTTTSGHYLFAPYFIDGSDKVVMVSRGFIPFEDRLPETWLKYDFDKANNATLEGVVKKSITPWLIGPKNPKTALNQPFQTRFFFEEIGKMADQLPYTVLRDVYIQKLGSPPTGQYPKEAVAIEVPPSTHYGYTLEWASLGVVTLLVGFLLQAFPQYRGLFSFSEAPPQGEPK